MPPPTDPITTTDLSRVPLPSDASAETAAPSSGLLSGPAFGPPAEPGDVGTLGPYRVLRLLGKGGMGAVYLAADTRLGRHLALKVMLPALAADRTARERFVRESRAAARITHDHVVTVYEADERDGVPYIAMQLLQGYSLDNYLRDKGPPPLVHAVRIGREAALGLAAAHDLGLIHRDVKPANLWLEAPHGRVKVLDFGLAKPLDADGEVSGSGMVVGTPAYMSPEQARGEPVDARADLFSLGAVLYQLVTGRRPFVGATAAAALMALAADDPPPARDLNPDVPPALAALIHQLLAKRPDARPPTAAEVARRLRAARDGLLAGPPPDASTSLPIVVAYPVPRADPPMVITAEHPSVFAGLDDDATARTDATPRPGARPAGGRGALVAAVAAVVLAAAVVAGAAVAGKKRRAPELPPEPPAATPGPLAAAKDVRGGAAKAVATPGAPADPTADLTGWTMLKPSAMTAESGATLTLQKDGAVLVSGPLPTTDVYTLTFRAPAAALNDLRLDVLPHDSLPRGGPGRSGESFVLTKIKSRLEGLQPRGLTFAAAEDTCAAVDSHGGHAIDADDGTGWASEVGRPHRAVFRFDGPVVPDGAALRVVLEFKHHTHHRVLGHFRLLAR